METRWHVRAYHGTRKLPKAHVARMRISMPATLEPWVSDVNGDPILVVIAPPSASTAAEVRRLLPELAQLAGGRRSTVVFDRGGWSPDLFAHLLDEGFDLLTYRKGATRPEPRTAFVEHTWIDERGVEHRWELADRTVRIRLSAKGAKHRGRKTIRLRQIVRRSPDGHQTQILTSRFDLTAAEIAARMFNRWRQENYFRYGRAHFALDGLDTYTTIADDPDRSVPNPAKRDTRRTIRRLEATIASGEAALGRHRNSAALDGSLDELEATLAEVRGQLEDARQTAADIPARVPLATIAPDARLLDSETKLLTHACRIAAYNTESSLARLLAPHYARAGDEARSLLREAFTLAGDLHIADGRLHVTLNPASAPRRSRALAAICEQLNDTETVYPGTDLVLHYAIKATPNVA